MTTTTEGNIRDVDVQCLNSTRTKVLFGSANCYPVKIEGSMIRVGTQAGASGLAINDYFYNWLTGEAASCTAGLGLTNCEYDVLTMPVGNTACTSSGVTTLRYDSATDTMCTTNILSVTWKDKTT